MKKSYSSMFLSALLLILTLGCCRENNTPKYLFYFIGDGMGNNIVNAAEFYLGAKKGIENRADSITFSYFPKFGSINTSSNDAYITDSAAAGTALACGEKTNNGTIGMDSTQTIKLESVATYAKKMGMGVGIMTSVSIDHATPAAFYAHNPSRGNYHEISQDGVDSNIDFFAGSGFKKPTKDGVNVYDLYKKSGYHHVEGRSSLSMIDTCNSKILLTERAGADVSSLAYAVDRGSNDLTLKDIVKSATDYLFRKYKKEGFFIMAEGGKIDWAAHSNDAKAAIGEVIDLDEAVKVAYEFYLQHPDETLIVVTADHETGGYGNNSVYNPRRLLANIPSIDQYSAKLESLGEVDFEDIPLPGDFKFTAEELAYLKNAYKLIVERHKKGIFEDAGAMYRESNSAFATEVYNVINIGVGAGWTTGGHTCSNVMVYSIGAGAEKFVGHKDNTDIPKLFKSFVK